jgi:hypothetical protein
MEGNLWKTPGEELEPEWSSRMASSDAAGQTRQGRAACEGENSFSVSEGETKVTRAACLWHTCSRTSPEGPMQSRQDHGGPAGKANDLRPASR